MVCPTYTSFAPTLFLRRRFNNEENDRSGMSANVGDRAAKELYYKPFAAAVDAGVGSAMCR